MLGLAGVVSLLTMAVPSSAALIFSDPLQGSTSGTSHYVSASATYVTLNHEESWVKYTSPEVPSACGTVSLWLRIEQGCEGSEVISDGYLEAPDGVWPTFRVDLTQDGGTGKYTLGLHYWAGGGLPQWRHLQGPAQLVPDVWYHVGVTWGEESATEKGMAIWVDGVRKAHDPAIADPHQHPADYPFQCWGLGCVYNRGAVMPTCHNVSIKYLRMYDVIEPYGGTNAEPVLTWAGTAGFKTDGVSPDRVENHGLLTFRACYTDREGNGPVGGVKLHLLRSGVPITGSPFFLQRLSGTDYATGVVYSHARKLPWGDYSYYFETADRYHAAIGDPTAMQSGPEVITPPVLARARVVPTSGDPTTRFRYWVDYRSADGKPAGWVELEVKHYTPGVGWARTAYRRKNVAAGTSVLRALTLGTLFPDATRFQYRFRALKGRPPCRLYVATVWTGGPTLTSAASAHSLMLSSVSAAPTPAGGAQVVFSLSAPAEVTARILNLAGRPVRSLSPAAGIPGPNMLLWDGRSEAGLGVPAGQYLTEVTARAADGQQAHSLAPLHLQR